MDRTVTISSSSTIGASDFALKFYAVDQAALLLTATVAGSRYDFYYFPRAQLLCVEGEAKGVFKRPAIPGSFSTFEISATAISVDGVNHGFDSGVTQCSGATHLAPATFRSALGEVRAGSGLLTTSHA